MYDHIVVVKRTEENLIAIVSYQTKSDKHLSPDDIMDLLVKSITEWVSNTEDGKAAWKSSCEDFNVGDLSAFTRYTSLLGYLHANDIWNLDVNIVGNGDCPTNYTYDTVLVDGM
jgi:hypothetical protein